MRLNRAMLSVCLVGGIVPFGGSVANENPPPSDSAIKEMSNIVIDFNGEFAAASAIYEFAEERGFKGEIAVDLGNLTISGWTSRDMRREGYVPFRSRSADWPFASITKQILVARMLPELALADMTLDTPISKLVPAISRNVEMPTVRQLMQHRSGLRNPEDTPLDANGLPEFYSKPEKYGLDWCLKGRSAPPKSGWTYNNCDYIVLGAAFDELSFAPVDYMLGDSSATVIAGDESASRGGTRFFINESNVDELYDIAEPERTVLPNYGASGALAGPLQDLIFSNWGYMFNYGDDEDPLGPMWDGDENLGYMALGQWVFEIQPKGCAGPVKVAQRKGAIGRYRLENIMLPELKRSIVFATSSPEFEFGDLWSPDSNIHAAVSLLACSEPH